MRIPTLADISAPNISADFTGGTNPFNLMKTISSNPTASGMRDGGVFRDLVALGFRSFLATVLVLALIYGLSYLCKYGLVKKPQEVAESKMQVIKYVAITLLASCVVGIMNALLYLIASTFGMTIS